MTNPERHKANIALAKLSFGRKHNLNQFLKKAAKLHPQIATALEGIWCGESGEVRIVDIDERSALVVHWYNKKVEVAYIS